MQEAVTRKSMLIGLALSLALFGSWMLFSWSVFYTKILWQQSDADQNSFVEGIMYTTWSLICFLCFLAITLGCLFFIVGRTKLIILNILALGCFIAISIVNKNINSSDIGSGLFIAIIIGFIMLCFYLLIVAAELKNYITNKELSFSGLIALVINTLALLTLTQV